MVIKQFIKLTNPCITPWRNSLSFLAGVKGWVSDNNTQDGITSPFLLLSIAHPRRWEKVPLLIVAPAGSVGFLNSFPQRNTECFWGSRRNRNPQEEGNTHVLGLCGLSMGFFIAIWKRWQNTLGAVSLGTSSSFAFSKLDSLASLQLPGWFSRQQLWGVECTGNSEKWGYELTITIWFIYQKTFLKKNILAFRLLTVEIFKLGEKQLF